MRHAGVAHHRAATVTSFGQAFEFLHLWRDNYLLRPGGGSASETLVLGRPVLVRLGKEQHMHHDNHLSIFFSAAEQPVARHTTLK